MELGLNDVSVVVLVDEGVGKPANASLLLYMLSLLPPPHNSVPLPEQTMLQSLELDAGPPPLSVVLPQTARCCVSRNPAEVMRRGHEDVQHWVAYSTPASVKLFVLHANVHNSTVRLAPGKVFWK
jgi:hypothetical protein